MRLFAFVSATMALALPAFALSASQRDPVSVAHYPNVRQVKCDEGSGTAFYTTRGWMSVNHVTSLSHCKIDGVEIEAKQDGSLDLSTLEVPLLAVPLKINCDGFK